MSFLLGGFIYSYAYNVPLGDNIGSFMNNFDKSYALNASQLSTTSEENDCIIFTFDIKLFLGNSDRIMSIRNGTDNILLSVGLNDAGRLFVSRSFKGEMIHYEIYDLMFESLSSIGNQYEMRIFLCANFMWIEVLNETQTLSTPIFWGGTLETQNIVEHLLGRNSTYEIVFGDEGNTKAELIHKSLNLYASKHADIFYNIQNYFLPQAVFWKKDSAPFIKMKHINMFYC